MNEAVLGFSFGVCLLTGLVFGLLPASQIAEKDPQAGLREASRGASAGRGVHRARGLMVALQFALAIVLLTGAGLLIRSFLLLNALQPGFDATHLLTMTLRLPDARYHSEARQRAFLEEVVEKIEALPGVRGAAVGSAVFGSFREHVPNTSLLIEGRPLVQSVERHGRSTVSDGYFRVMGIPLLQGRLFSSEDIPGGPPAGVINQTMARRYWPGETAVGKRFKDMLPGEDGPWTTVIGVVGDVLYNRDGTVVPVFYRPSRQWWVTDTSLVVRTEGDPLTLAKGIRQAARSADSTVPWFEVTTVEQRLEALDRPRRFQTALIGAFAAAALILTVLGLYGLVSYSVEQRTREIGIRVALGASAGGVVRLILGESLVWAFGGVVMGAAGALVFGRALSASLYGVTASDPPTVAAVITTLAAVSALAAGLPARRATRVDPTAALRHE